MTFSLQPRHQHVDAEGKCYLPALSQWHPQQSNVAAVVGELQGVFAVNPPVFAKPKDMASVKPPSNPYGVGNSASNSPAHSNSNPALNYGNAYDYRGSPVVASPPSAAYDHRSPSGGGAGVASPPSSAASQRHEALRKQATDLVQKECRKVAEEVSGFMNTQVLLENGMSEIDEALQKMLEHKRQLQLAIDWTKKANADLDDWLATHGRDSAPQPVNVDEIVIPTSPAAAQLLAAVAGNKAIEDALYVLNKALLSDDVKMDCETFAKEHRKLCSAQFMHLALIRKIHQSGQLK